MEKKSIEEWISENLFYCSTIMLMRLLPAHHTYLQISYCLYGLGPGLLGVVDKAPSSTSYISPDLILPIWPGPWTARCGQSFLMQSDPRNNAQSNSISLTNYLI